MDVQWDKKSIYLLPSLRLELSHSIYAIHNGKIAPKFQKTEGVVWNW